MAVATKPKHFQERLKGKLEPTPNGSVYIDPEKMEWIPSQLTKFRRKCFTVMMMKAL